MTRREAAEKVAKLRRLAMKAGTKAESENAARAADKIAAEHGLTAGDIEIDAKVAAFDEMVERMKEFVSSHPDLAMPNVVLDEVGGRLKADARPEDKAAVLDKFVSGFRTACMIEKALGGRKMAPLKKIVDDVLRKHDVTV